MSGSYPLLKRNSNDQGKKLTAASSVLFKHVVRASSTLRVRKSDDGGICLLLRGEHQTDGATGLGIAVTRPVWGQT